LCEFNVPENTGTISKRKLKISKTNNKIGQIRWIL